MSNLPRKKLVIEKIRSQIPQIDNLKDLGDLLYNTLVEFQYPDKNIGKNFKIFGYDCEDDEGNIMIFYKNKKNRILSEIGIEQRRPEIRWFQSLIQESGWLKRMNEISENFYCEDYFEFQEEENQQLLEYIESHNFKANTFLNTTEELEEMTIEMLKLMEKLLFVNNKLYLFEIILQFLLFNQDLLRDSLKKVIVKKIDEIANDDPESLKMYRPFFDSSIEIIDFKHMKNNELFDLILDDKRYQQLYQGEINLLEKILLSLNKLPEKIQNYLLDLSDDKKQIWKQDTNYLDDEIDNAIHPREDFVPNPSDLDEDDPEYESQFQNWILENDVVLDENYLPEDPEDELEQKKEFEEELIKNITSRKQKLISSSLRKLISQLNCNNKIDPITMDEISEKNYLELKWIIVLDESGKVGDCYDKEDLIKSMHQNATFGTFPDRDSKYYKEPLKGVWVDVNGLKIIPRSKIIQLQKIGKDKIGTRFGISRTHGDISDIYTFKKLF